MSKSACPPGDVKASSEVKNSDLDPNLAIDLAELKSRAGPPIKLLEDTLDKALIGPNPEGPAFI